MGIVLVIKAVLSVMSGDAETIVVVSDSNRIPVTLSPYTVYEWVRCSLLAFYGHRLK